MFYIFLSICCSVTVSVLLKLAKRYQIDVYQAITWNYSAAILLTWVFFRPHMINLQGAPVVTYVSLGILFPLLFVVIAASVRLTGIVRTDVAQRLSLFIPVLAAFLIFGERPNIIKIIGIVHRVDRHVMPDPMETEAAVRRRPTNAWFYLVLIFVGMGVIDVLLKTDRQRQPAYLSLHRYLLFLYLHLLFPSLGLFIWYATKKMRFSWPHILIGWVLGAANFGNILFYIKAPRLWQTRPSTVFSTMDIGVIVLGAMVGLFIFKEKLSRLNLVGIILAIIAIVIIYYPEIFQHLAALIF